MLAGISDYMSKNINKIKKIYKFAFHVNQVYCADFKIIRQKNKIIISTILWVETLKLSSGLKPFETMLYFR